MTRNRNARRAPGRAGPAWLKLLLIPLLLFGFSTMHTLGHAEHAGHGGDHAAVAAPGEHHSGEHNAAPWAEQATQENLPDLDPTEMCPTLSGFAAVHPAAATTVVTAWPQAPPRWRAQVRAFDPSGVEAENKPSLAGLQILRV